MATQRDRVLWWLAPADSLLYVLLFALLIEGAAVYLRLQQPWIGLQVRPGETELLVVDSVARDSPLGNALQPGQYLQALETTARRIPLVKLVRTEPFSVRNYQDYAYYQTLHLALFQALTSVQPLALVTDDEHKLSVSPLPQTPLRGIPAVFWWLSLSNLLAPLLGALVWAYKPYTLESACLALACISFFCFQTIFTLIISRELYIPPAFFVTLLPIQAALLNLFTLSLYLILCYYPNRLMPKWAIYPGVTVATLLSLNYEYQWVEIPFQAFLFQYVPIILLGTWLMRRQWTASRGNPVDRTTVLMLQLSAMLPCWLIMLLYILPIALGHDPLIGPIANRLLFLFIFAGWTIGILRFRLFDMEYWWFKSLLWLLGGSLVVLLDLALAGFLKTSANLTLGLSVIIAGFIYFPLRQWLLGRIIPAELRPLQDFLPAFSSRMSDATSKELFEQRWQESLMQRFGPLHMQTVHEPSDTTTLSENGLHLDVPALDGVQTYRLSGKQRAARLFNKLDVQNTESLLTVARMASNASEQRRQAIMEERRRIMHDLHDSVGARLLTLTHKLPDPAHKAEAKRALMVLRDTIRLSLKTGPLRLDEHLADWRAEIAERTEAAGVGLLWQQHGDIAAYQFTTRQVLELTQVLREAVNNALRHARPERLGVVVSLQKHTLCLDVINDGVVNLPERWQAGTGVQSMRLRMRKMGGTVRFLVRKLPVPHLVVRLVLPLEK